MEAAAPRHTHARDLTVVSSAAQGGDTPLHNLCGNKSVTLEMMQALHALHPAAAGEKSNVRFCSPAVDSRAI